MTTLSPAEQANQITAYKIEQRRLRAAIVTICNSIQETEAAWTEFDAGIVDGGPYEAAQVIHAAVMTPELAAGIAQLRQTLVGAVAIAQQLQAASETAGDNLFPGLWMPSLVEG